MRKFKNWTEYHHRLNLTFHAIVALTMIPFVWLYLEIDSGERTQIFDDLVILILFLLVSSSLIATSFIYKINQLKLIDRTVSLREKLIAYFKVLLITYALLETSAVFATLAFYLTANYLFVIVYLISLFVFSVYRPKVETAVRDLNLNDREKNILINRSTIP